MIFMFLIGSQVFAQIVEIHEFGETNVQHYIYSDGITWEFNAKNTMTVDTIEVKSVLASNGGTFHIEISIRDSLIANWDQYVNDVQYKPYIHTKQVSYSLSEGDTIVYHALTGTGGNYNVWIDNLSTAGYSIVGVPLTPEGIR